MSSANRPAPAPASAPVRSASSTSSSARERVGTAARGLKRHWDGGEGSSSRKINVNINGPDGALVTYTIPVDLPMQKLLRKYCDHKKLEYLVMDFLYQGQRLQVRRSAEELHLEEGDQIDAYMRVHGGGVGGANCKVETVCTN